MGFLIVARRHFSAPRKLEDTEDTRIPERTTISHTVTVTVLVLQILTGRRLLRRECSFERRTPYCHNQCCHRRENLAPWMHGLHQFMVGFCKAAEPKSIDSLTGFLSEQGTVRDCEHAQSINYCVQIFLFSYPTEEDHSRGICQSWSPHQIGIWQERLVVWYGIFHIVSQKRLRRSCPLSLFLRHHWNLCLFRWTLLCCDVPCSFLFFLFFLCVLSKFVFRSSTATQQHSNAANIDLDCARRCGWWRRGERGDQTAQQQNGRRSLALQRIWRSSEVFEFEDAKSDRSRIISMCFLSIFVCSVFDFDLRRRRWL